MDCYGGKIKCYPEVPEVLETLYNKGYTLAVASRTSEIKGARQLIELFGWEKYFRYKEIFPGCKVQHFKKYAILYVTSGGSRIFLGAIIYAAWFSILSLQFHYL